MGGSRGGGGWMAPLVEVHKKKVEEPKETSMKKKKSIHQKMYEIATAKYNPFAVGGSESINSLGGSENVQKGNN